MATIKNPVGFGGVNDSVDVCTVQYLLNCVPAANGGPPVELPVDGAKHGPGFTKLVDAIRRFQARIFQGWSDGRVDPQGQTLMHLRRWNPADPIFGGYIKQGSASTPSGEDPAFKTIKGQAPSPTKSGAPGKQDFATQKVASQKGGGFKGGAGFPQSSPGAQPSFPQSLPGPGIKGGNTKGGNMKGMPSSGGFTDPFNMKGGGGGVNPSPSTIKGGTASPQPEKQVGPTLIS